MKEQTIDEVIFYDLIWLKLRN